MSTQDRTTSTRPHGRTVPRPHDVARTAWSHLASTLERVGFWLAVVLPFLALPLLATGVSTRSEQVALGVILVCNVFAVIIGNKHQP